MVSLERGRGIGEGHTHSLSRSLRSQAASLLSAPFSMASTCCGSLLGSCGATMCCKACSCKCMLSAKGASFGYIVLLSSFVMLALLFRYAGGDIVLGGSSNATANSLIQNAQDLALNHGKHYWNSRFWCAPKHPGGWVICCEDTCGGVFAVYRFSFALALFFALMILCTVGTSRAGAGMHRGFWIAKGARVSRPPSRPLPLPSPPRLPCLPTPPRRPPPAFLAVGLLVTTLWVDNSFLAGYREVARYASFLFLGMQILLLIDFGYTWNEKWLEYEALGNCEGCCNWRLAIISCSVFLYLSALGMWIAQYAMFASEGCPAQTSLITLTLLVTVSLTIVSCSKLAPHGTILTSAVVTAYATFLCFSALASHPDPHCNPRANEGGPSDLLVGLLVAGISIGVTANSATGSKAAILGNTSTSSTELTTTLEDGTPKDTGAAPAADDDDGSSYGAESWWYYHTMMVACSMYMSMLLTDWSHLPAEQNGVPAISLLEQDRASRYGVDLGSFWVKIVSQWVCLLMYAWTLLAPFCLRHVRDFGVDFSSFD